MLRDGKHRRRSGRCIIDGLREIGRAAHAGIAFTEIYILESEADRVVPLLAKTLEKISPDSVYLVSGPVFDKLAFGNRQEGIVAVALTPARTIDQMAEAIRPIAVPLLAVLECVEKPGNVGAIFRSADGAGLDGIMLVDSTTDLFNPNTIRSSLGTVFSLPAALAGPEESVRWLRDRGFSLAVARCDGAIPYTDYDFTQPTAIVLGSESGGLSDVWQGPDMVPVKLPMLGIADSLNVSNAAAVLFYEARRQHG